MFGGHYLLNSVYYANLVYQTSKSKWTFKPIGYILPDRSWAKVKLGFEISLGLKRDCLAELSVKIKSNSKTENEVLNFGHVL